MAALWGMWIVLLLGSSNCYENLSRRRTTTLSQSSTYSDHPASRANDENLSTTEQYCAHTDTISGTRAWFQVDLGKPYSIKSVTIYYRREGEYPGDWKQYRFRQFYLDVSDSPAISTTTSQRSRCYTDNSTGTALPENIIEIPCKQTARYIIVETKYIYNNDPGPVLEICEIEVYGCETGKYGEGCWPCQWPCLTCDVINGACIISCGANCLYNTCDSSNGYCTNGCTKKFWGNTCTFPCPLNCFSETCYRNSGNCIGECKQGYSGERCDRNCSEFCNGQECDQNSSQCKGCVQGRYGNFCRETCNSGCLNNKCVQNGGVCLNGCRDYKYGYWCENECNINCTPRQCARLDGSCSGCNSGHFGSNCSKTCSSNCREGSCDQQTGKCNGGCKQNWAGDQCDRCDSIHYGTDCSQECSDNCLHKICYNSTGSCIYNCKPGFYGQKCDQPCSTSCPSGCDRVFGECVGSCENGKFGKQCNETCDPNCEGGCNKLSGSCDFGCSGQKYGAYCKRICSPGCASKCEQLNGHCSCILGWQGDTCNECRPDYYGTKCDAKCSENCINQTCFSNNGSCIGGCIGDFNGDQCMQAQLQSDPSSAPTAAIGAGLGAGLFLIVAVILAGIFILRNRRRKQPESRSTAFQFHTKNGVPSAENKLYTNIANVPVTIEDPEEEPQIENPEEAVYYNDLSVAKDIAVSDLLNVITRKEANEMEGFQKEFKSLPYGERFACETAKTAENMPRNRFKTTFPYDHSRVILEVGNGFTSDYINANYIENMEGKKEFIACQGPRENTVIDHWRMIWQENVEYIVMLTNLIEGPKVKCHQYWPDEGKDLEINPFSVTLVEEKVYAYFVERKMTVRKKRVNGSRTVVQYHYTRWPDHGTPNPLNLVVFHRHFRHKIKPSQHPIIVHCSAGIGRTGTFIALDVLSRYGKDKGKVNVIEYVKAMRKDRMTMIQNVDQYVFLYHALYEFFRRKAQYKKKDEFLNHYGDVNRINTQKHLTNEFNELISLKPRYDAHDFKSGKKFSKMNFTKSVLPVEQYLVYLTSHVAGRECYYNAVNVSSFTRAEEFISAQYPVPGATIDLVRLLIDHESAFLISLNPLSEVKELQSWVEDKQNPVKLSPYTITKGAETSLTKEIRKITLNITNKEKSSENHEIQIFECLNWSSDEALPKETSGLTNLIKQFTLDRKYHPDGNITVISKDGATCCGVFIAVYNAIEQLQQDDEVDLSTIVQQLQCRRPEMISTKEEYEFCFKALSDFLNTDNVYANS